MTDLEILSHTDFIHDKGCGRGGFRIHVFPKWKLYEERAILMSLEGEYVNPLGPFRKYANLQATVMTQNTKFTLRYHKEFWEQCTEASFLSNYMEPFLYHLRELIRCDYPTPIPKLSAEYSVSRESLQQDDKINFEGWLIDIVK